jgi:hypothetical protein
MFGFDEDTSPAFEFPPVVKIVGDQGRGELLRGRALRLLRNSQSQNIQNLPVWQTTYYQDPLTGRMVAPGVGADVFICTTIHGHGQVVIGCVGLASSPSRMELTESREDMYSFDSDSKKEFLVFYKQDNMTLLAVFTITESSAIKSLTRLGPADTAEVVRKDNKKVSRFIGIDGPVVVHQKELSPSDGKRVLCGFPFIENAGVFSYTGFEFKYTDHLIMPYKLFDGPNLYRGWILYGVYINKTSEFEYICEGPHANCGAGFAYKGNDTALFFNMSSVAVEPGGWTNNLVVYWDMREVRLSDLFVVRETNQGAMHRVYAIGSSGDMTGYDYFLQLGDLTSRFEEGVYLKKAHDGLAVQIENTTVRYAIFSYSANERLYENNGMYVTGAVVPIVEPTVGGWHIPSYCVGIDGRLLRDLSSEEIGAKPYAGGKNPKLGAFYTQNAFSGVVSYDKVDGWYNYSTDNNSTISYKTTPYLYESGGELCLGHFTRGSTYGSSGGDFSVYLEGAVVENGYDTVLPGYHAYAGVLANAFPMTFPFGMQRADAFSIITKTNYHISIEYIHPVSTSISKKLHTPYETVDLPTRGRPVGWMQIQTAANKHVFQGVLIVDDETGEILGNRIWHNRKRIDLRLAERLGVENTDILGILYLPGSTT